MEDEDKVLADEDASVTAVEDKLAAVVVGTTLPAALLLLLENILFLMPLVVIDGKLNLGACPKLLGNFFVVGDGDGDGD